MNFIGARSSSEVLLFLIGIMFCIFYLTVRPIVFIMGQLFFSPLNRLPIQLFSYDLLSPAKIPFMALILPYSSVKTVLFSIVPGLIDDSLLFLIVILFVQGVLLFLPVLAFLRM